MILRRQWSKRIVRLQPQAPGRQSPNMQNTSSNLGNQVQTASSCQPAVSLHQAPHCWLASQPAGHQEVDAHRTQATKPAVSSVVCWLLIQHTQHIRVDSGEDPSSHRFVPNIVYTRVPTAATPYARVQVNGSRKSCTCQASGDAGSTVPTCWLASHPPAPPCRQSSPHESAAAGASGLALGAAPSQPPCCQPCLHSSMLAVSTGHSRNRSEQFVVKPESPLCGGWLDVVMRICTMQSGAAQLIPSASCKE